MVEPMTEKHLDNTINWLKRSFAVNNGRGSSAYYQMILPGIIGKWSKPYPETSGYLIPSVIAYCKIKQDNTLAAYLHSTLDWLLSIQKENGAFPGGIGIDGADSVFNSAQILQGLIVYHKHYPSDRIEQAISKCEAYIINSIDDKGNWIRGAFVESYTPTYYSRVLWPLVERQIQVNGKLGPHSRIHLVLIKLLENLSEHEIKNMGFVKGSKAFSHTIAYTLRGFLEIGNLLNDQNLIRRVSSYLKIFKDMFDIRASIPYQMTSDFIPNYDYSCPVGSFQMSVLFFRFAEITERLEYRTLAKQIYESARKTILTKGSRNIKGGVPGSSPIYGPYQRFRLINWGAKFHIDAALANHNFGQRS